MSIQDDYLDPDRHLWPAEEPEDYTEAWEFLNDCYNLDKDNRRENSIKRGVYKHTDCGAWIEFKDTGIELGSIVEGSDCGADEINLSWKEVPTKFWESLQAIEDQCKLIWDWANVTREDGMTDAERGLDCPWL